MGEDSTRLNIERAREALARARADQVAAAVRAPRPADLSRLQEDEARRLSIDTRAGAFRSQLRDQLGLGEYRGPEAPASSYVSKMISAPLCDADVCAPPRPPVEHSVDTGGDPAAPPRPQDDAIELRDEAIEMQDEPSAAAPPVSDMSAEAAEADTPLVVNEVITDRVEDSPPKKRKKFLGLF